MLGVLQIHEKHRKYNKKTPTCTQNHTSNHTSEYAADREETHIKT